MLEVEEQDPSYSENAKSLGCAAVVYTPPEQLLTTMCIGSQQLNKKLTRRKGDSDKGGPKAAFRAPDPDASGAS